MLCYKKISKVSRQIKTTFSCTLGLKYFVWVNFCLVFVINYSKSIHVSCNFYKLTFLIFQFILFCYLQIIQHCTCVRNECISSINPSCSRPFRALKNRRPLIKPAQRKSQPPALTTHSYTRTLLLNPHSRPPAKFTARPYISRLISRARPSSRALFHFATCAHGVRHTHTRVFSHRFTRESEIRRVFSRKTCLWFIAPSDD